MYKIADVNLPWLQKKIDKLNKKALKLNVDPIQILVHNAFYEGDKGKIKFFEITIEGDAPKLNGWEFLGTINHLNNNNIFHNVPGKSIPETYRNVSVKWCDHCKTRRNRKNTYVVQHEDGTTMQVGGTCLKDFLGHTNPKQLVNFVDGLTELIDLSPDFIKINDINYPHYYKLEDILKVTACFIVKFGWMSRRKHYELWEKYRDDVNVYIPKPTVEYVNNFYFDPRATEERKVVDSLKDDPEVLDLFNGSLEWAKSLVGTEGLNDYLFNISALIQNSHITDREFGLAVSIVGSYYVKLVMDAVHIPKAESEWIGEVKERRDFRVQVLFHRIFDSEYGIKTLYNMVTEKNEILVWWSSNAPIQLEEDENHWYNIKGTVKKHDTYKGKKQTVLTRVKFLN